MIKATARALLCLETSAASGANIIGNISDIAKDPMCPFPKSQWKKKIQQNTRDFSY